MFISPVHRSGKMTLLRRFRMLLAGILSMRRMLSKVGHHPWIKKTIMYVKKL